MKDLPTVGSSAMVYTMFGLLLGLVVNKTVRIYNRNRFILLVTGILLSLIISQFKENSNFDLHLDTLLLGFIISAIALNRKKINSTK